MQKACLLSFILTLFLFSNCKKGYMDRYGPFYVLNDTTVVMNGDMGSRIKVQFDKLIDKYPNIKLIKMEQCPGSRDDETMFEAAIKLKQLNINTHLSENAQIESGAVDFYLAGSKRTREPGSKIGVHAWSDGSSSATDFPIEHNEHQIYIDFYKNIGRTQQEAESLYFFIINAAAPEDIYWMSESDILNFNICN